MGAPNSKASVAAQSFRCCGGTSTCSRGFTETGSTDVLKHGFLLKGTPDGWQQHFVTIYKGGRLDAYANRKGYEVHRTTLYIESVLQKCDSSATSGKDLAVINLRTKVQTNVSGNLGFLLPMYEYETPRTTSWVAPSEEEAWEWQAAINCALNGKRDHPVGGA